MHRRVLEKRPCPQEMSEEIKRMLESTGKIDEETLSRMNLFAEFSSHLDYETLQTRFTL
jgi:hypothetical protein